MKKRIIIITITLLIVVMSVSIYFSIRKPEERSLAERIPIPKPHEHIAPDGTVVEHLHTYKLSEPPKEIAEPSDNNPEISIEKKSPWVQQWEKLDLAAIKKDYQPYTVTKMLEMWDPKLLDSFGPNPPADIIASVAEADRVYPRAAYLARMLELGRPFVHLKDYEHAMVLRRILLKERKELDNMDASEKIEYFERRGLPPDATWDVYEDYKLKRDVVHNARFHRAWDANPALEAKMKPPQRPERPAPPSSPDAVPPEESSSTPPDKED